MPKRKPTNRASRRIDWPAIEADFRAGMAVIEIARRHDVSPSAIYRHARKGRWTGDRAVGPEKARGPRAEAPTVAGELRRLRALTAKLGERLECVIDGRAPDGKVLGARESPAALLLKLCQITEKIISIERQLGGADAPTPAQLNEQDREILDRFKRRFHVG